MNKSQQRERVDAMRSYLEAIGHSISSNQGYELLARGLGLKSRHVLASTDNENPSSASTVPASIRIGKETVPVLAHDAPPLTVAQMEAQNWELDYVIAMPYSPGWQSDMGSFNDEASLRLTGNECALSDIGYIQISSTIYPQGFVAVRVFGRVEDPQEFFEEVSEKNRTLFYARLQTLYRTLEEGVACSLQEVGSPIVERGQLLDINQAMLARLVEYAVTHGQTNEALNAAAEPSLFEAPLAVFNTWDKRITLTVADFKYAELRPDGSWFMGRRDNRRVSLRIDK